MTRDWPRGPFAGTATTIVAAIVLVVLAAASVETGDELEGGTPADPATVVATFQTSTRAFSDDLVLALKANRAAPDDRQKAKAAARLLINEGRALGDSRLVGAAIGLLRPFMESPDAEALYLEALARQYQHDFPGAIDLLDRSVAIDPRHVNAILTRATVHIVIGQFDEALQGCRRLAELQRLQTAFLCESTALLLTPRAVEVKERLDLLLALPGLLEGGLREWAMSLSAEIAVLQGDDEEARQTLERLVTEDGAPSRERLLLADLHLRNGAPAEALDLLADVPDVDGVLLRRALAGRALGQEAVAAPAAAAMGRRVRANLELGLTAHAREETQYFLQLADDPAMALSRARVNWDLQHELVDAQLLIDAAMAAGQPEAAAPVLDWIEAQDVSVPVLEVPDAVREARE